MRYFIDTEFAEKPGCIDLISIALVDENGREFYAEVLDFDETLANDWVKARVLPNLWRNLCPEDRLQNWGACAGGGLLPLAEIGPAVQQFIGEDIPEFWG